MSSGSATIAPGRPEILFPLFAEVSALPGIGPKYARLFEKLGARTIFELLSLKPHRLIDRGYRPRIAEAEPGRVATIRVRIDRHMPGHGPRPTKVRVSDETGFLTLVFFHAEASYLMRLLPPGEARLVSGEMDEFHGERQMTHPDLVVTEEEFAKLPRFEPVYPATAGLSPRIVAKAVKAALANVPELPEWEDAYWMRNNATPAFAAALREVHAPTHAHDLDANAPARARLAYDELLASQLALGLMRAREHGARGRALQSDGRLRGKILAALPYKLTGAQARCISEIVADLAAPRRMVRLLQGDVGAGKTIVSVLAMAAAVEAGAQAALMAPTEILVRQHAERITPLAAAAGLRLAVLTGRDKGAARTQSLAALEAGLIDILIGTHALLEEDIRFKDLGLVVVDEQHRFGVHQRLALAAKGERPVDLLVMTATPIPRTLTLAMYGDMEVSRLDEKPPGRRPIKTVLVASTRLEDVVARLKAALRGGARAYWVCPLVEESEVVDLAAAEERAAFLEARFPGRVGLVHGRLKAAEKQHVMETFAAGAISLLVATTVIEVGVDVPDATIMIIEQAERFGLAQLHQLRGRVGRGRAASTCLLLYRAPLGETAEARLKILRATEDGFLIAEEDLRLRGAGDLLGARQSGMPDFRFADLEAHGELLAAARDDARLVLERDAQLLSERGKALRLLLYLFSRDEAVRLLRAG
ncbi:MAG: ATP-dependent DNA helicase RecG [Alphaproteobacteria bacterium]